MHIFSVLGNTLLKAAFIMGVIPVYIKLPSSKSQTLETHSVRNQISLTPLLRCYWRSSYFLFYRFELLTSSLSFQWTFNAFKFQISLLTNFPSSTSINTDTIHKVFANYFEVYWNSSMLPRSLLVEYLTNESFGWLCFIFICFLVQYQV